MVGECRTSKTDVVHHYYKCATAKKRKGCDKKVIKKEWIEDLVVNYTMKIVMDDELIETIADRILDLLSQENTKIPQLQAKLKEVDGYIKNILDAVQQGLFNASAKKRLDDLEQTKAEIETAIYSEQLQRPEITKGHILYYIERYRKININDLESRKRLIDTFVNSIYLYDDKIVFPFNYKDGTKAVSLTELDEELSSDLEVTTPPPRRLGFGAQNKGNANTAFPFILLPYALAAFRIGNRDSSNDVAFRFAPLTDSFGRIAA